MAKSASKLPVKRRKPAAYHHGDLKRELVAAGRRVLEAKGVEGLSLRAVAREAGVSQAAPYHHFADKDALLAAIATQGFEGLAAEMARWSADAKSNADHVQGLGAGYVVFAYLNPQLFQVMHGPQFDVSEKYADLLTAAFESYQMLERGVAACMPCADAATLDTACKAAWSLVHGASMLIVDKRIDAGDSVEEIAAFANSLTCQLPLNGAR